MTQAKKDPRHGCYIYVPVSLAWTATDHDRKRMAALLLSTFAGTDGLEMLLAQTALALSRTRQPEILHVLVGPGADGKSMIMVELLRACFGSGFGNPSCTLLQAQEAQVARCFGCTPDPDLTGGARVPTARPQLLPVRHADFRRGSPRSRSSGRRVQGLRGRGLHAFETQPRGGNTVCFVGVLCKGLAHELRGHTPCADCHGDLACETLSLHLPAEHLDLRVGRGLHKGSDLRGGRGCQELLFIAVSCLGLLPRLAVPIHDPAYTVAVVRSTGACGDREPDGQG